MIERPLTEPVPLMLVKGAVRWYAAGKVMPPHPPSVVEDTQRWRSNSDPIEGFWQERLQPDPTAYITSGDMTKAFNAYLLSINQREWSDRRFQPAFSDHTTTRSHGVWWEKRRVPPGWIRSYRPSISINPGGLGMPNQVITGTWVRGYWGVRFIHDKYSDLD